MKSDNGFMQRSVLVLQCSVLILLLGCEQVDSNQSSSDELEAVSAQTENERRPSDDLESTTPFNEDDKMTSPDRSESESSNGEKGSDAAQSDPGASDLAANNHVETFPDNHLFHYIPQDQIAAIEKGTSTFDVTVQVQQWLNKAGTLVAPAGKFLLDCTHTNLAKKPGPDPDFDYGVLKYAVRVLSHSRIILDKNSEFHCKPTKSYNYAAFAIFDVSDVSIEGGKLIGERDAHILPDPLPKPNKHGRINLGEWGFGVDVRNARRVLLKNIAASNFWGDGFYIATHNNKQLASQTRSDDITVENCTANNNRRQGLSVVGATNVKIIGGRYSNTSGTNPQAGIDLEPNAGVRNEKILIDNVLLDNNEIGLLLIHSDEVVVKNTKILNNRASNVQLFDGSLTLTDSVLQGNPKNAHVLIAGRKDASHRGDYLINNNTFDSLGGKLIHSNPKSSADFSGHIKVTNNTFKLSGRHDKNTLRAKHDTNITSQVRGNTVILADELALSKLNQGLFETVEGTWKFSDNTIENRSGMESDIKIRKH